MNILIGTLLIGAMAFRLWLWLPNRAWRQASGRASLEMLKFTGLRVVVALFGAAYFAELLPEEIVRAYLGPEAGWRGIALAIAMGPLTPGGAFVSFAIGAAGLKAGAAPLVIMVYVTSWSLFSTTKLLAYELPLMGPALMWQRVIVSLPVPFVVAGLGSFFL